MAKTARRILRVFADATRHDVRGARRSMTIVGSKEKSGGCNVSKIDSKVVVELHRNLNLGQDTTREW